MTLLDLQPPTPMPINEGQFQSAWYYSIIVAGMVALVLVGCGWGVRGGVRVWREGDHAAGSIITAASLTGTLLLLGMLLAGALGLHNMFRGG